MKSGQPGAIRSFIKIAGVIFCLLLFTASICESVESTSPLVVTAAQLQRRIASGEKPLIVDIRPQNAFIEKHIPGSINIASHLVKTKRFLKSSAFIIVDEGFHLQKLEDLCHQLMREYSMNARFLFGGLNAWKSSGGGFRGKRPAPNDLDHIPVKDFYTILHQGRCRIIVTEPPDIQVPSFLKDLILPFTGDEKKFLKQFSKNFNPQEIIPENAFVLVFAPESGNDMNRLIDLIRKQKNAPPLFILTQGLEGYHRFAAEQERIYRERKTVGKNRSGCRSCR